MPTRNFELSLRMDGKAVAPYTLRLDPDELRRRAGQRGLDPRRLLAQEIRGQIASSYHIVASDQELTLVAQALLEQGANRLHPLSVTEGTDAETNAQLTTLKNKLENTLITLQQERVAHRRERERLEDELVMTQGSMSRIETELGQLRTQYTGLQGRYERLKRVEDELLMAQRQVEELRTERDNLQGVIERFQEHEEGAQRRLSELTIQLHTTILERDHAQQEMRRLQALVEEGSTTIKHLQSLLARAFTQIIRVMGNQPLAMDPELSAAIDAYRRTQVYGS